MALIPDSNYKFSIFHLYNRLKDPAYDAVYMVYHLITGSRLKRKYLQNRLARKYGIYIANGVSIGIGLKIPHPTGIIIGRDVSIGDNVMLYQQVTIGGKNQGDTRCGNVPRIGNNVIIYAGAKVLGNIHVADNCIVGAMSVLTHSTDENSIWAGIPAIKKK